MCEHCDYKTYLMTGQGVLDDLKELLEAQPDNEKAEIFAGRKDTFVRGIVEWIEDNNHVTLKQQVALGRAEEAVAKWLAHC